MLQDDVLGHKQLYWYQSGEEPQKWQVCCEGTAPNDDSRNRQLAREARLRAIRRQQATGVRIRGSQTSTISKNWLPTVHLLIYYLPVQMQSSNAEESKQQCAFR